MQMRVMRGEMEEGLAQRGLQMRKTELKEVKHHFVDEILPDRHFSAGEFGIDGRKIIDKIIGQKKIPIIVGGTGLYIRSLVDGLFSGPGRKEE